MLGSIHYPYRQVLPRYNPPYEAPFTICTAHGTATHAPAPAGMGPSGLHERADARPKRQREVSRGRGFGPLGAYIREENPSYRIREYSNILIFASLRCSTIPHLAML